MTRTLSKRWLALSGGTAILFGGVLALAVTGPFGTPPRVIAYGGTLEQNGMPVSGNIPMTFYIVNTPTAPITGALFQEDYPAASPVSVVGGHFEVELGSKTPNTGIPDSALQGGETYVAVSISGVELSGRQRLVAAPYAITAAQAKDFAITGALTVTGVTTLNGATAIHNTLAVDRATTLGATATDSTHITGDLTTSGPATFNGTVRSVGTLTANGTLSAVTANVTTLNEATADNATSVTNGYLRMPGSTLEMRWGSSTSTLDGSQTFTFSRAFANGCYFVVANRTAGNTASNLDPTSCNATGFSIDREDGIDGSEPFTYFAIGH